MSNLSQGPEVYQYIPPGRQATSIEQRVPFNSPQVIFNSPPTHNNASYPPPALNKFGESQIERVYEPIVPPNQQPPQYTANQVYVNSTRPTFEAQYQPPVVYQPQNPNPLPINASSAQPGDPSLQNRFDTYPAPQNSYKYNLFSVADEPWNNCLKGQKCGGLPSNECIASEPPARQWK